VRIPIWGGLLFFSLEGWEARGGLVNGRVFICEVVGGWMTCGVGGGSDRNAGARVGGGRMTCGAMMVLVWALVCGWERGDVEDSWAARKMTKQSC
jgi:hypothetical protein